MFYNKNYIIRNELSNINIEWFEIKGLFGRNNVKLNLKNKVNIYIGENGFGKTTVLNCIYYILTKKFDKLEKIEFDEINIKLKNMIQEYYISKSDIIEYTSKKSIRRKYLKDTLYSEFLIEYFANFHNEKNQFDDIYTKERISYGIRKLSSLYGIPIPFAREIVYNYIENGKLAYENIKRGKAENVEKLIRALEKQVPQKILYFTTYRRIEDDLSNIIRGTDDYSDGDILIKFGMHDVEKNIESLLNEIKDESRENLNKMTGILLSQYSSNIVSEYGNKKIIEDIAKIVLDRLSNQIKPSTKENIINLVKNGQIYQDNYKYLLNLLNNLMENYEAQKIYEEKINNFVETCNKYLRRKRFVYDQSNFKLFIEMCNSKSQDSSLELSKLSSGEKQIVSLFSKLYLENNKDNIILIDEPELSISMHWQRMLLPDIINSGNCSLLLTVTHSPFIFDNEFEYNAKEIRYSNDDDDWC